MRLSVKMAAFAAICVGSAYLYFTGLFEKIVVSLGVFGVLGIAMLGVFYSSGITFPIAVAAFASVANDFHPLAIATFGAAGAMVADLAMLSMIEKAVGSKIRLNEHLEITIPEIKDARSKFLMMLAAGVMLALPFPDEIPIAMLGLEKADLKKVALFIYAFKFVGVLSLSEAVLLATNVA